MDNEPAPGLETATPEWPPLLTVTGMRLWLEEDGVRLTKSLGQNFLHDGNQLTRIVAAAALNPGDRVLEVGPGLGPLTERLLRAGASVLTVEKDSRLAELLKRRLGNLAGLEIIVADALGWLQETPRDWSGWRLVANLPYSVASPIVVELALAARPPERITVTLQREVADRLAAAPGSKAYGLLTVLAALHYQPAGRFIIPASCFFPAPEVESACITLARRPAPLAPPHAAAAYVAVAKTAFSQRRKMLGKLLRARWPAERVEQALKAAGAAATARAETLPPEAFAAMAQTLAAG